MKITSKQLKIIAPSIGANASIYVPLLNEYMERYGIDTPKRIAYFLAQLSHESNDFRRLSENLNYSSYGLLKTFPKYFNSLEAKQYERQPQKIANRVYANRYGNGDERSGDGWKYRGRGLLQLTFKANYKKYGYESNPDELLTPYGAVESACKFWKVNNLNRFADAGDIAGLTKVINGGTNGLGDRKKRLDRAFKAMY